MADLAHGSGHSSAPHGDAHGHGHSPFLAHHFDTLDQQFNAGKLGMWLFLATEILLFGGLFCAYAVYRANHPEIFEVGHLALDKKWGAINTVVLLLSSFTMAWAVSCAQKGAQTGLRIGLFLTLLGGFGFMGIKFVEYKAKFEHGYLWGKYYHSTEQPGAHHEPSSAHAAGGHATTSAPADAHAPAASAAPAAPATPSPATAAAGSKADPAMLPLEPSTIKTAHSAPGGLATTPEQVHANNIHLFFSIYFLMTGLHGLHVLAGMGVIGFLLMKSFQGAYGPEYFTPVDLGGLYWHLVDLIWIYLFPLLYLIH
ncbi:MAG: cytochrome c oxidase subunit 3 [Phycisphaerales bacterium]|nr:cytochrome c oxidase subunit 3 [Phycisphaerales bacterium]